MIHVATPPKRLAADAIEELRATFPAGSTVFYVCKRMTAANTRYLRFYSIKDNRPQDETHTVCVATVNRWDDDSCCLVSKWSPSDVVGELARTLYPQGYDNTDPLSGPVYHHDPSQSLRGWSL